MTPKVIEDWFPNGTLRLRTTLQNGVPDGYSHEYFADGKPRLEYQYSRGFLHGSCRQWAEDGRLSGEFNMSYGTGMLKVWYDEGALKMTQEHRAGELHGATVFYNRDETVALRQYFFEGKKVSRKKYDKMSQKESM